MTGEFNDFTIEDWMDNKKWFDVKLLTDVSSDDNTKALSSDTYGKKIAKVLKKLNIHSSKLLHLGRNMGSKILDLLEEEAEDIRRMGQWKPSTFDNSYSSKLPMGPMRKLAGYNSDTKIYFNTRTTVEPPNDLLHKTPIGKWVYESLYELENTEGGLEHTTAIAALLS